MSQLRLNPLTGRWVTVVAEGFILIGLLWALHRRGLRPIAPSQLRRSFAALLAERR